MIFVQLISGTASSRPGTPQIQPSTTSATNTMIVLLVAVVLIALWAVGIYNGLVGGRNGYKNAFAQIDVQLTRRYDLIPNLVETAKGYMVRVARCTSRPASVAASVKSAAAGAISPTTTIGHRMAAR